MKDQVVVSSAFRKKSFLVQPSKQVFVEERDTVVENRKQVIEMFIEKRAEIKRNERLTKLGHLPVLVESEIATIEELEKSLRPRFEGKHSAGYVASKALKVE